jgi:hypothetical protein
VTRLPGCAPNVADTVSASATTTAADQGADAIHSLMPPPVTG